MALLANGASALKHLVTMSTHQLFGFAMIDAHQGLVAHHDPEVSVVDDQGIGDAVQDPVQELFTRRDRIHFQFHEDLVTADTSTDERYCQRFTRRTGRRRCTSDVSSLLHDFNKRGNGLPHNDLMASKSDGDSAPATLSP
jgi:hypothetical protein